MICYKRKKQTEMKAKKEYKKRIVFSNLQLKQVKSKKDDKKSELFL